MKPTRRDFLKLATGVAAAGVLPQAGAATRSAPRKIKAVAFDAFPIYDPRPVFALAESLFPGKGKALGRLWRSRQFEYQWLRVLGNRYEDFWKATEDGLVFAARNLGLKLTAARRERLMGAYLELKVWPDVPSGLRALRDAGIRLAFLSNMTPGMLQTNARRAGIEHYFEHLISTDRAKTYKPDTRAYQLGVDILSLKREEIVFAPFAGWDMAGAKWFGYPTFWVNRARFQAEELGAVPDGMGTDLQALAAFVKRSGTVY